jgi:rhodanese-related sulfurtransferase
VNKPPGLLVEAVAVLAAGLVLGWAGNGLSPRGLNVDRDYFPRAAQAPADTGAPAPSGTTPPADATPPAGTTTPADATDAATVTSPQNGAADAAQRKAILRLHARGLQPITFEEARATYLDPLCAAGAYVFLDARNENEHALGHIPGAYVFDHYRMERYLAQIMALAPGTMRMVVYCTGGDCEDSEYAAHTLADLLPDPSVLRVYVGGITEWEQRGMPVETGARGSGVMAGGGAAGNAGGSTGGGR